MFATIREMMITGLAVGRLMEMRCSAIRERAVDDVVELSKRIKLDERLSKVRDKFWEETDIAQIRETALGEAIKASRKVTEELENIAEKLKKNPKSQEDSGAGI